ncbi:hypothetical protein VDG44_09755 [Xanthomonas campestris pv. raphani]|uniref:hypothetical protein n=1 Tax=Xanthomonas campestris TaxID=339 RepID=UPI002B22D159|nr:hypothetical protein [Xanthomonas campestris]MEA9739411.1 hypothetical protein [Xanthomonas campestris pv. raphani]MEA9904840.1 hypothetical protein [Xanthomonas campestris pv. raphani]
MCVAASAVGCKAAHMHSLMTCLYLLCAGAAACGFYLATAHQRLWLRGGPRARVLRAGAGVLLVLAAICAIAASGTWAGVFSALTAAMLAAVALPFLDAWQQARTQRTQRRQVRHVE